MLHDVDLQEYRYPQLHYALKRVGAAPMTWEKFKELPTTDTPEDIANIPVGAILLHEHDFPQDRESLTIIKENKLLDNPLTGQPYAMYIYEGDGSVSFLDDNSTPYKIRFMLLKRFRIIPAKMVVCLGLVSVPQGDNPWEATLAEIRRENAKTEVFAKENQDRLPAVREAVINNCIVVDGIITRTARTQATIPHEIMVARKDTVRLFYTYNCEWALEYEDLTEEEKSTLNKADAEICNYCWRKAAIPSSAWIEYYSVLRILQMGRVPDRGLQGMLYTRVNDEG